MQQLLVLEATATLEAFDWNHRNNIMTNVVGKSLDWPWVPSPDCLTWLFLFVTKTYVFLKTHYRHNMTQQYVTLVNKQNECTIWNTKWQRRVSLLFYALAVSDLSYHIGYSRCLLKEWVPADWLTNCVAYTWLQIKVCDKTLSSKSVVSLGEPIKNFTGVGHSGSLTLHNHDVGS